MRSLIAALAIFAFASAAQAESTEGKVTKVDADSMTVTLDDGKTYRLPAEMDVSVIAEGAELLIAYDVGADGVNQITDMEVTQ